MQGSEVDNRSYRERVRQDYLRAMGIQTWFPRCQLPNAQPPRPFDWIAEDAATWQRENQIISSPEPAPQRKALRPVASYSRPKASDILSQAHIDDEPEHKPSAPEKTVTKATVLKGTPASSRFRLIVHTVNDDCLVIAEMPHSGLNQFTRFHQRLLDDLLRALDISSDQQTSAPGEFVWPIPTRRGLLAQINLDDYSAAEAVCAFLSNQFGFARRKVVLLLGQAAARFVIDPEKKFEELRGIQQGTFAEQYFATTHSLNELMKLPQHKAEAWHDLAPLLRIRTPSTQPEQ